MKTLNTFVIYFNLLFYRAEVTFLIPIGEMDFFFFSIILCCVLLVTVLFLFQKAAINNTLISNECLCDFILWR